MSGVVARFIFFRAHTYVLGLRWLYHTVYRAFHFMTMAFLGIGTGIRYDRVMLSDGDGVNHNENPSVQFHEDLQL